MMFVNGTAEGFLQFEDSDVSAVVSIRRSRAKYLLIRQSEDKVSTKSGSSSEPLCIKYHLCAPSFSTYSLSSSTLSALPL